MAGLGEVCTHVGAVLFFLSSAVEIRDSRTVTQEKAYWLLPSGLKTVTYATVENINFKSAKSMKKGIDCAISHKPVKTVKPLSLPTTPAPSSDEQAALLKGLHESGNRPVILSLMPEYADHYVPKQLNRAFPQLLSELRDERSFELDWDELVLKCEQLFCDITVTLDQVRLVEETTRQQAGCREWHRFRTGRITASRMKSVCRTNVHKPAKSLIKGICYPDSVRFTTAATAWGCDHEKDALEEYQKRMETTHDGFKMEMSGFVISDKFPFIGASPDSIVECNCCGKGTVEVKCPYCVRDKLVEEKVACLENVDGRTQLSRTHQYYYQVQTQIFVCNVDYSDFVVWTKEGIHQERVAPDNDLWEEICERSTGFFKLAVLPEIVGKYFSRIHPSTSAATVVASTSRSTAVDNSVELFCVCQTEHDEDAKYIGCDNIECIYKWCHYECMGVKRAPKGKWYCTECRKMPQYKPSKKRKVSNVTNLGN